MRNLEIGDILGQKKGFELVATVDQLPFTKKQPLFKNWLIKEQIRKGENKTGKGHRGV